MRRNLKKLDFWNNFFKNRDWGVLFQFLRELQHWLDKEFSTLLYKKQDSDKIYNSLFLFHHLVPLEYMYSIFLIK